MTGVLLTQNEREAHDVAMLVSIDPGKWASGYAIWIDAVLVACGLAKTQNDILKHWQPGGVCYGRGWPVRVLLELPQVYGRKQQKGDPNDLVYVSAAGAHLGGAVRPAELKVVLPRQWKGTTPKPIHNERTLRALTTTERRLAPKNHNVLDAIGLGLWEFQRDLQ